MTPTFKLAALITALTVSVVNGDLPDGSRVIAQSDTGRVLYRMIACDNATLSATDCHVREQQRLDRRLREQWVAAAATRYAIALTADEEAEVARQLAAEADHFAGAAAHFHALAVAALEIRRGKDRAGLMPELARQGITTQELDRELALVPTVADAERAAATDYVAASRKSAREFTARKYVLRHLHAIVTKRSIEDRTSFDIDEEHFWSDVARAIHTQIIDPAFSMPAKKGIMVNP
jgi:hypothetical protein